MIASFETKNQFQTYSSLKLLNILCFMLDSCLTALFLTSVVVFFSKLREWWTLDNCFNINTVLIYYNVVNSLVHFFQLHKLCSIKTSYV